MSEIAELSAPARAQLNTLVAEREQELERRRVELAKLRSARGVVTGAEKGTAKAISAADLLLGVQQNLQKFRDEASVKGAKTPGVPSVALKAEVHAKEIVAVQGESVTLPNEKPKYYERAVQVDLVPKEAEPILAETKEPETVSVGIEERTVKPETVLPGLETKRKEEPTRVVLEKPEVTPEDFNKLLNSESLALFVADSSKVLEKALATTRKIDVFRDYSGYEEKSSATAVEKLTQVSIFEDSKWTVGRKVLSLANSSKFKNVFLSSHGSRGDTPASEPDGCVLVWSTENPSRPEYVFTSPSPVQTAIWNPSHANLIIGGTYGGSILVWDTRSTSRPVLRTTPGSGGHQTPVVSAFVTGSQHAQQLLTIDEESRACLWSVSMALSLVAGADLKPPKKATDTGMSASESVSRRMMTLAADLSNTQSGTLATALNFWGGCEDGSLYEGTVSGNEFTVQNFIQGEGGASEDMGTLQTSGAAAETAAGCSLHSGPITGMHWHPTGAQTDSTSDLLVTSSADWSIKLWAPGTVKTPIASFERGSADYIWDVKWSPTHPGVFASVDTAGVVDMWNLCDSIYQPVRTHKLTSQKPALNKLLWLGQDGRNVAVGGAEGSIRILAVGGDDQTPTKEQTERLDTKIEEMKLRSSQTVGTSI